MSQVTNVDACSLLFGYWMDFCEKRNIEIVMYMCSVDRLVVVVMIGGYRKEVVASSIMSVKI